MRPVHRLGWLAVVCAAASARPLAAQPTLPTRAPVTADLVRGRARVPLQPDTRPIVAAWINGHGPFRLLVETGSPVSYLTATAMRRAELDSQRPTDSVRIGDAVLRQLPFNTAPALGVAGIDGLLGLDAFRSVTLTLAFAEQTLHLEADTLPAADQREILPLRLAGPFWALPLRMGTDTVDAVLDTQSALAITAPTALAPKLSFTTAPVTVGRARGPAIGDVPVQRARLAHSAWLGSLELQQPIVDVMPIAAGLPQTYIIGLQVLRQLDLSLDQRTARARLRRTPRVIPPPPPLYSTGLGTLRLEDGTRRVSSIIPGSAAEASFAVGDIVLAANGQPVSTFTDDAWRLLTTGPAAITLRVRRGSDERDVMLQPRAVGF
ncbi:MAG: PDZ domain-containing protein [Gemmatimonadaceae bacterium]|nr:PDZ domain-containing protein [Gemmatimonadaceae bacterium]